MVNSVYAVMGGPENSSGYESILLYHALSRAVKVFFVFPSFFWKIAWVGRENPSPPGAADLLGPAICGAFFCFEMQNKLSTPHVDNLFCDVEF